jgi:hypothetical protein
MHNLGARVNTLCVWVFTNSDHKAATRYAYRSVKMQTLRTRMHAVTTSVLCTLAPPVLLADPTRCDEVDNSIRWALNTVVTWTCDGYEISVMALLFLPPRCKFVSLWCCYYGLQGNKSMGLAHPSILKSSALNDMNVRSVVLRPVPFGPTDTHDFPYGRSGPSWTHNYILNSKQLTPEPYKKYHSHPTKKSELCFILK